MSAQRKVHLEDREGLAPLALCERGEWKFFNGPDIRRTFRGVPVENRCCRCLRARPRRKRRTG